MPLKSNGSANLTSANFMKLYDSLPPEARHSLVEKKLAPLLDSVSKERAKKVMQSSNLLQKRYADIPYLDFKGKKKEINSLLDELARDSKRAFVRERSNRDELLAEIIDSILSWLNDIWTVVYTYNVLFEEAHACLLYIAEVLNTLNNTPGIGGCKCSISQVPVHFSVTQKGKVVKKWAMAGPRNIDRVLLWIWRDLFVSMFAKGKHTEKIPEMLVEIEECWDWQALERLLYGGAKSGSPDYDHDDEDDEASYMDDTCLEETSDEEDQSWRCPCPLHGSHWSENINEHRMELRDLVHQHLLALFELTPSHKIFSSILAISPDAEETEGELLAIVSRIAGSSADTLVAALDIHGAEGNPAELMALLDAHAYLLRPRDAPVLQAAVGILADFSVSQPRALKLAEKELFDTVATVRAAVRASFCRVEEKAALDGLAEIAKLRSGTVARSHRVDAWVDSVMTPGPPPMHPMAFAAMMMGFPLAPGMDDGEDMDLMGYLDLDQRDPDLEDLREEFRPKLRERFEGWVDTAKDMKGGHALLTKLYVKIFDEMLYLKTSDVTDEMLNRLNEYSGKAHVSDALDSLVSFCKTQRKKLAARADKKRKSEAAKKAATTATSAAPATPAPIGQRSGFPFSFLSSTQPASSTAGSSSTPFPTGIGGMEDVD
ncbi:hypothetical protein B0H10DRAFT_2040928 [Mycena sp. CBHHK59/15]|nr:hypothetical protein B0H10DRAFT_2040928 [Mycena sp. CBHHK59/15]